MAALIFAIVLAGLSPCFADIALSSTHGLSLKAPPYKGIAGGRQPDPSSGFFNVHGNVYPKGFYYVLINIGEPPQPYFLDVDTGSDLTWLKCDAPCISGSKGPNELYRPMKKRLVPPKDPLCTALQESTNPQLCNISEDEQCDYEIKYLDGGSSIGVLMADAFAFADTALAFGCGYDQQAGPLEEGHSATDGVLGLGKGKVSILSQLSERGIFRNIVSLCLSKHVGFLFFGEYRVVPPRMITWAPMSTEIEHYSPGAARVYADKQLLGEKQVMIFDSGSTYTYFNDRLYQNLLDAVTMDISNTPLKEAPEDKALPHCWKRKGLFNSVLDLNEYKIRSLKLTFGNRKLAPTLMEIPPENYFIMTEEKNVCLGILNGTEVGLASDWNIIGDISMQDVMVVYDNEKQRIGWAHVDHCDQPRMFANSPP